MPQRLDAANLLRPEKGKGTVQKRKRLKIDLNVSANIIGSSRSINPAWDFWAGLLFPGRDIDRLL
jgi:hypothetical protein